MDARVRARSSRRADEFGEPAVEHEAGRCRPLASGVSAASMRTRGRQTVWQVPTASQTRFPDLWDVAPAKLADVNIRFGEGPCGSCTVPILRGAPAEARWRRRSSRIPACRRLHLSWISFNRPSSAEVPEACHAPPSAVALQRDLGAFDPAKLPAEADRGAGIDDVPVDAPRLGPTRCGEPSVLTERTYAPTEGSASASGFWARLPHR